MPYYAPVPPPRCRSVDGLLSFLAGSLLPSALMQLTLRKIELLRRLNIFITETPAIAREQARQVSSTSLKHV